MLQTAPDEYHARLFLPPPRGLWHRTDVAPFRPQDISKDVVVAPTVNHGRWLIDCPGEDCTGAQLAHPDRALFFCVDCLNEDVGGDWVSVQWPDEADDVERVLGARRSKNRNWIPVETVGDLWAENVRAAVSQLDDVPEGLRDEVESKLPRAVQLTESIELEDGTVITRRLPGVVEAVLAELPKEAAKELMDLPTEFPRELKGKTKQLTAPYAPHVIADDVVVHPDSELA